MGQTLDQVPVGSAESAKTSEPPYPCAPPLDTSSAMQRAPIEKLNHELAALEDGLVVVSLAATQVERSGSVRRSIPGFSTSDALFHGRIGAEEVHRAGMFPEATAHVRAIPHGALTNDATERIGHPLSGPS